MMKKIILLSILMLCYFRTLNAQDGIPLNSNYLIENGISPRVLDAAVSELLQDGSFDQNYIITIRKNGDEKTFKTKIIYDPGYEEGKDLRFIIEDGSFTKNEIRQLKKAIEKNHSMSRLSRSYLYDESSLNLLKNADGLKVLGFNYSKRDIEPELKDIKKMKGKVYIKDGSLEKVVLTSDKKLSEGKTNYIKTIYYKRTNNLNGYIVTGGNESYDIGDTSYFYEFTTSEYKDENSNVVDWKGKDTVERLFADNIDIDTVNVTLGGILPIWGKPSTKLGYSLPRPFGISAVTHDQNSVLDFTGLGIGFNNDELTRLDGVFDIGTSKLNQNTVTYMVRGDAWIFPFLNVMGIVGRADNSINGSLVLDQELRETLVTLAPALGLDPEDIPTELPLNIDVSANIYGFGATLAGGVGDLFFTGSYQYLVADVSEANTTTIAHNVFPSIGYRFPGNLNIMAGTMGQFYDSDINGFIETDTGDILRYNVAFEPVVWNYVAGIYKGFGKHWDLLFQIGIGDRKSTTVQLGYRF